MIHQDVREVVNDIRIRQMRGGTVVTHAALKALRSAAMKSHANAPAQFLQELKENVEHLATIRTASTPLSNGLREVLSEVEQAAHAGAGVEELKMTVSRATEMERSSTKLGQPQ